MVEFCGAFQGTALKQNNETMEQFAERIQDAMNRVMAKYAKRLNVSMGVDFGDLRPEDQSSPQSGIAE